MSVLFLGLVVRMGRVKVWFFCRCMEGGRFSCGVWLVLVVLMMKVWVV